MAEHPLPTSFLCASCGAEVCLDWVAPNFGLCEGCEERMMHGPVSYVPPGKEQVDER